MKVKILSKKGNKVHFLLSGTTPAFANALRRIMISEVPTLAVDYVNIEDNNSVFFDEVLAHRIGLVPLEFPDKLNLKEECKCEGKGCALCEATLVLEKSGPCFVHAKDLKSSNKEVKPVEGDSIIVELLEKQKVKLEAVARLGRGTEHAKWQAANAVYQTYPVVEVSNVAKAKKFMKDNGLDEVFDTSGKIEVSDLTKIDLIGLKDPEGSFEVKEDDTKFIFKVESISGLAPEDIILQSVEILKKKTEEFKSQLKELKA